MSVPRHWSQKRKYLQGKLGIEKPPFKLPEFIEATGIGECGVDCWMGRGRRPVGIGLSRAHWQDPRCVRLIASLAASPSKSAGHFADSSCTYPPVLPWLVGEMRQAYLEKVESQKMKQKARERMQPKMGKLDIDYQVRRVWAWAVVVALLPDHRGCVISASLAACRVAGVA